MAEFSLRVNVVKAGEGRSPLAANAYICGALAKECDSVIASSTYLSGTQIGDHDYRAKRGVLHTEFIGPHKYWRNLDAPNRERFWKDVYDFEKANNRRFYDRGSGTPIASLAREHKVNLPFELPIEQNIKLARAYALEYRRKYGVAGEFAVHAAPEKGDTRNIHFRFLHNERAVDESGDFSPRKASFTRGKRAAELYEMRNWWSERVLRELRNHGIVSGFDHRSFEDQGIERLPTKHMGPRITKLERAGIPTWIGEYNRAVTRFYQENNRKPNHDELKKIKRRAAIARRHGERKLDANRSSHRHRRTIDRIGKICAILAEIRLPVTIPRQRHRQHIQDFIEAAESIGRLCIAIASTYGNRRYRVVSGTEGIFLPAAKLSEASLGNFSPAGMISDRLFQTKHALYFPRGFLLSHNDAFEVRKLAGI